MKIFGDGGEDFGAEAGGEVVFVDDEELAGAAGGGGDGVAVPGVDAAEVEEVDAGFGLVVDGFHDVLGDGDGGAPGDEGEVIAFGDAAGLAEGDDLGFDVVGGGGVAVVEADFGVEEDGGSVGVEGGVEEAGGVAGGGGHEDVDAGDMGEHGLEGLGVEGAESGAVSAAGDHEDDGALEHTGGAPVHGAELGHDLADAVGQEVGELDEADGLAAGEGSADGAADDGGFGEGGVDDAVRGRRWRGRG